MALQETKKQIASAKIMTHYDPTVPIKLVTDASAYGVGTIISYVMSDGSERWIVLPHVH